MDFAQRYAKLNPAQTQAVDKINGPVMVVAGPGTGKTELLSMRAANILRLTDTLPENILCLTFTDSGAAAMRERLVEIIGPAGYRVAIHTFHSFGAEIINQNAEFFYHGANFKAADELSSYELLRQIFDNLNYDNPLAVKMNDDYPHLADTITVISELKKAGLNSDELLLILDANQQVIDQVQPILAEIFASKISKSTAQSLHDVLDQIRTSGGEVDLPGIVPLSQLIADSLASAVNEAAESNSTKPVTAWRNAWMKKDETGAFILKASERSIKLRQVSQIYRQYLEDMQAAELYDFDDMILQVVHKMEDSPELLFNLQEKYQYVMVDEFQDTNLAQMRILHNLTSSPVNEGQPDIMVVGDDDQAIYSFQGADISNILNFQASYDQSTIITLTDNYRSADNILTASREVITQGNERLEATLADLDKTLTPWHKPASSKVSLLELGTPYDEREHLVESIARQIAEGEPASSIAVLARRHHEIISLLPHFASRNIAVNYERRDNVLEIEPIITLETVAKLLVALYEQRHDEVNVLLPEMLAHPAWNIDAMDIWKLSLSAHRQRKSWMEVMSETPTFVPLHAWLVTVAQQVPHMPLEYILDHIIGREALEGVEYKSPLFDYFFPAKKLETNPDEYLVFLEALRTLRTKLREYRPLEAPTLQKLLDFIDLHRELGSAITSIRPQVETQTHAVNLMTAHKSKGLEFDSVYIIGAVDSAWGERVRSRSRLIGYPENLPLAPSGGNFDERLRLFFVAMTRARKQLTISYSTSDEKGKSLMPASFLLSTSLKLEVITTDRANDQLVKAAEQRWYQPLVSLSNGTMQELLAPSLKNYKLSITHLNNFLDVSRGGPQYFLMNNLLRFPQAMSPNAAYGSAIHATLQRAHSHLTATGQQQPIDQIIASFEDNLRAHHLSPGDFEDFLGKGKASIQTFLEEKYNTFSQSQKVELNFASQQVMVDEAHLTGSLDLVDINKEDKEITVTDYKTGRPSRSWTGKTDYEKIKLHKYKQQLMFYKLLVEQSRDYRNYTVTHGCLQFVEPTKSGEILSLEASCTEEELNNFKQLIKSVWWHITNLDLPNADEYSPDYRGMLELEHNLVDKMNEMNYYKG